MNIRKLLQLLSIAIFLINLASCQYNIKEEITVLNKNQIDYSFTLDLSSSINESNSKLYSQMLSQAINKALNKANKTDTSNVNLEEVLSRKANATKVIDINVSLDTIPQLSLERISQRIQENDTNTIIPKKEREIVATSLHNILKNITFRYYANPKEKKYYAKIKIKNLTFDTNFDILKKYILQVKKETNDKKFPFPFLPMIFEDNYIINRNSLFDEETKSKLESMMEAQVMALKNSNYTLIYHFPYNLKKKYIDNKDFKIQSDKKTLKFESNIYDLQMGNITSEVRIKLKQ